ncbi:MAG: hypothetical protein QG577_93 [Thermodesulfobacteriota bacterium]|nr:hypothetical protein [Thermodesulfobacteriota bacterium]
MWQASPLPSSILTSVKEMPKKYQIHVDPTPNRFPKIGRSGIVDWGEGCLKCAECVKTKCIYQVYQKRTFSTDILGDTADELCKSCFRCVQGCPKRLIHKTINPEWEALGDDVYTPEVISVNWEQAETGKIPVSGAGYGGFFSGPGFDAMWTDMSEIVRPTRDGIHGREYISTVVELGRRNPYLAIDQQGKLHSEILPSIRLPMPVLFDLLPFGDLSFRVWEAIASAASILGTLAILPLPEALRLKQHRPHVATFLEKRDAIDVSLKDFPMVEMDQHEAFLERLRVIKRELPGVLVSVRMSATMRPGRVEEIVEYHRSGVDVIHFVADERGYEPGSVNGRHITAVMREVHADLLRNGLRDEITLLMSGGVAMAEHVIKSMLCGANLVGVDVPMLLAMECRVCRNCREDRECPVEISQIDTTWGAKRIVNLIGAWHNQFLEMMGAMGIREARRLTGEQGRVMFLEDLEKDTFARLFSRG